MLTLRSRLGLVTTILAIPGVLVISGCVAYKPLGPTQSDRLMQTYPDLLNGRFAVIADFESPGHKELVQCEIRSPQATCRVRPTGGRRETGRHAVEFVAGSDEDAVALNNLEAENWSLTRDWRPYDLLLLSVHSPERGLNAVVQVAAGSSAERLSAESSVPLAEGWNVLRLDLEEIAEHLPLDDIQEIRISVARVDHPIRIQLDDIILTGNRRDLFGDSGNTEGRLYLQQVGRRWRVGAGGRFELTFANGQIVAWYNLANDPYRLQNLVQGTTLGPNPLVLTESDTSESPPEATRSVIVHPQVLEVNSVRAVIAGEWRPADDLDASQDQPAICRSVYTIYPTGQIFAQVEYSVSTLPTSAGRTGLAITLATPDRGELRTYLAQRTESSAEDVPFATAHNASADASVLYVAAPSDPAPLDMIEQLNEEQRRLSLVAVGEGEGPVQGPWQCHVLLASTDELTTDEALARANGFRHPPAPGLQLGSLVERSGPRPNPNGFDLASGCFVIDPDRGRVRLTIDGRETPLFYPAFRIINTDGRAAQVYVDHIVLDNLATTGQGDLVFQVPRIVSDQVVIEVYFRRP